MKAILSTIRARADHLAHRKSFTASHGIMHAAYFGFVFVEGHGIYALMGLPLLIITLVDLIGGE